MKKISVDTFFQQAKERLHLTPLAEEGMPERYIVSVDINRMGMALTGYLKWFAYERLQILGKTEIHYLATLKPAQRKKIFKTLLAYRIPAIVVTHKVKPPRELITEARLHQIPVFTTPTPTTKFVSEVSVYLEEEFAPETTLHGTLLDVYGVGILVLGNSGIGKSECALGGRRPGLYQAPGQPHPHGRPFGNHQAPHGNSRLRDHQYRKPFRRGRHPGQETY
jgi:HPr kinase/phosphorylase